MPIRKPARRAPLDELAVREANEQRARSARLARVELELDEVIALDQAAYAALVRLGMREDEDLDLASPAVGLIGNLRGDAMLTRIRLESERRELKEKQHAPADETPRQTLIRVLIDRGVSRREAARLAGSYTRAIDVPHHVRGKAWRDAKRRDTAIAAEIRHLRGERRRFEQQVHGFVDFRHFAYEKIDARIAQLQSLLSRRERA